MLESAVWAATVHADDGVDQGGGVHFFFVACRDAVHIALRACLRFVWARVWISDTTRPPCWMAEREERSVAARRRKLYLSLLPTD